MELHPWSLTLTAAVLWPDLAFVFARPRPSSPTSTETSEPEPRWMTLLERVGQAGSFVLPLFFGWDFPGTGLTLGAWVVMALSLGLYYAGWMRYWVQGRSEALLYRPLAGVPVPLALAPVVYFGAASLVLGSWPQAVAAAALGVGHLGISWRASLRTR